MRILRKSLVSLNAALPEPIILQAGLALVILGVMVEQSNWPHQPVLVPQMGRKQNQA